MKTDCHNVIWKVYKQLEYMAKQLLDKMKSLSDIKQLLKEIKDEFMRNRSQNKRK